MAVKPEELHDPDPPDYRFVDELEGTIDQLLLQKRADSPASGYDHVFNVPTAKLEPHELVELARRYKSAGWDIAEFYETRTLRLLPYPPRLGRRVVPLRARLTWAPKPAPDRRKPLGKP